MELPDTLTVPLEIMPLSEWQAIGKAAEAELRGDYLTAELWRAKAGYDLAELTGIENVARYGE